MSKIINFPHERVKQQKALQKTGDAELIIFPGVRIERVRSEPGRTKGVRSAQSKTNQTSRANTLSALRKQVGKIKKT